MTVPVIRQAVDGGLELLPARWGLVPDWWRKPTPPSLTFNARSEEAASKPVWRDSLRHARGLMPARGWYEWNENEWIGGQGRRRNHPPCFLYCPHAPVIAFAALWSRWERPGWPAVLSCALLTKPAAPSIAAIHHRMPVVLKPEHYSAWLNPATPPESIPRMIADAREDLTGHPVSPRVNNVRNDDPDLMAPMPVASTGLLDFGADVSAPDRG